MEEATTEDTKELNYLELGIPEPEDHEIVMSRDQLGRCRRPNIKEAEFRVFTAGGEDGGGHSRGWWRRDWSGYTINKAESGAKTYNNAIGLYADFKGLFIYASHPSFPLQKPTEPEDLTKHKRKCSAERVLGAVVCACLKSQPNNESFRAKVMASVGEMPPKDCDTWDKIKDWVEFNFPKHVPKPVPSIILSLEVVKSEKQYGKCSFSRRVTSHASVEITREMIEKAIAAEVDFDSAMSRIQDKVNEEADEAEESYHDEETDCHEVHDSDGGDYDYNYTRLKNAVRQYLIDNKTREELDEIGID